jgi:hypothetical protein
MLVSSIQTILVMAGCVGATSDPQFGQCLELPITPLYPHDISFNYIPIYIPMIIMIFDYIRSSSTLGGMCKVARSQLPPALNISQLDVLTPQMWSHPEWDFVRLSSYGGWLRNPAPIGGLSHYL